MSRGKRDCITLRGERDWMMFRVVFMVVLARSDEPEFSAGLISAQVANFAGRMARDGQKQKSAAARPFHFDSKPLVRFVVEQNVRFGRPQNVPIQPVRALRRFILDRVEQSSIVGRPRDTGDAFETLGK